MQSTPEEFLLLLKKWKTDSAKVRVAAKFESSTGFASTTTMEGTLMLDEAESTVGVVSEDGSLFMAVYSGAGVGFSTGEEQGSRFPAVFGPSDEIEEILVITDASGATVCMFSLKI
jgi:hypothetical protein